jgi:hypothetical protein
MKRIPLHAAAWFLCALLAGCKVLGLEPVPQSFDGRLSAAYTLNTAIRDASTNSLASGAISSADAEKTLRENREVRTRLDQVRTISGADLSTAEARLKTLEQALQALRSELLEKGVKVQP